MKLSEIHSSSEDDVLFSICTHSTFEAVLVTVTSLVTDLVLILVLLLRKLWFLVFVTPASLVCMSFLFTLSLPLFCFLQIMMNKPDSGNSLMLNYGLVFEVCTAE